MRIAAVAAHRGLSSETFAVSAIVACEGDDAVSRVGQSTFGSFAIDAAIASSGWS